MRAGNSTPRQGVRIAHHFCVPSTSIPVAPLIVVHISCDYCLLHQPSGAGPFLSPYDYDAVSVASSSRKRRCTRDVGSQLRSPMRSLQIGASPVTPAKSTSTLALVSPVAHLTLSGCIGGTVRRGAKKQSNPLWDDATRSS